MDIIIRPERPQDYAAIADVNYNAFVNWHPAAFKAEPLLVDLLRHNAGFDPELSLVAELDGRIVGHVLFSPYEMIVLGTPQRGLILAPIAVEPDCQRLGVGKRLIARGHEIARAKGYALSSLCGHPEYYPRFGYLQRTFSLSGARVRLTDRAKREGRYEERSVLAADVPWIIDLWRRLHSGDDLALFPGASIAQWFNHSMHCRASVISRDGEAIGYARFKQSHPIGLRELLARDGEAHNLLAYLLEAYDEGGTGELSAALSAEALRAMLSAATGAEIADARETYDAFMLCPLDAANATVARYCDEVVAGRRRPGIIVYPAALDIDE